MNITRIQRILLTAILIVTFAAPAVGDRVLAETGVAVAEHFHKRVLPETIGALGRTRMVRIGDHCLSFYRRASRALQPETPAEEGVE